MKNFLRTSLYLFVFAFAGIMFQIACSNSEDQSLPSNAGKIIFTRWDAAGQSIWTSDYDGSNATQIPITLPPNTQFNNLNGNADAKLSPDGQTVFFVVASGTGGNAIYSCNIDGSNLQVVAPEITATSVTIGNAI